MVFNGINGANPLVYQNILQRSTLILARKRLVMTSLLSNRDDVNLIRLIKVCINVKKVLVGKNRKYYPLCIQVALHIAVRFFSVQLNAPVHQQIIGKKNKIKLVSHKFHVEIEEQLFFGRQSGKVLKSTCPSSREITSVF